MFWWKSHLDKTIVFCLIHLMKDPSGHHCTPPPPPPHHSRRVVGLFPGARWGLSVQHLHALPVLVWVRSSYSGLLPQSGVLWVLGTLCRCCDWMVVSLSMQPSDKLFSCPGFNCLCPKTTKIAPYLTPPPETKHLLTVFLWKFTHLKRSVSEIIHDSLSQGMHWDCPKTKIPSNLRFYQNLNSHTHAHQLVTVRWFCRELGQWQPSVFERSPHPIWLAACCSRSLSTLPQNVANEVDTLINLSLHFLSILRSEWRDT